MALLFLDGFDHYATADILKKWSSSVGAPTIVAASGRRGGGAIQLDATSESVTKAITAGASFIVGFAVYLNTAPAIGAQMMALLDAGSVQVDVRVNADLTISVTRNGAALTNGTSTNSLTTGSFYYIEFKCTISDSIAASSCVLRVNGADWITVAAGQDTKATVNASANQFRLGTAGVSLGTVLYDDLYVCDAAGATNNDFLGDVRIDTIFPNGAGTHQSWTPSTGTDHAALIDETIPNTTDYLTGGAAGSKESETLQDLSVNGAILGIQVNAALAKTDAGACTTKNLIRSGTTEANGAVFAPSTGYLYSSSIHETDPATSAAWLTAGVNALQAGVEVVS